MTTPYHSAWYAYQLTKRNASDDLAKLGVALSGATVDLNPHQLDAALFVFKSPLSRGALLGDEVGLGKTIEAGIVISQLWAERKRRILIITPTTLRKQWSQELAEKFFLPSRVLDTAEYKKLRRESIDSPLNQAEGIIICSYNFASANKSEIGRMPWNLVVIDEAHRLRNVYKPGNKIASAIKQAVRSNPMLLLTATPLQNNLLELYGLVSFIDEHVFGDVKSFRTRYQQGAAADRQLSELRQRLQPICKRTLRRDVAEYVRFTKRIAETIDFTPTVEEQELYNKVSEYLRREKLHALPSGQRQLMTLVLRKLLASSTFAIAGTLTALAERLESQAAAEILEEDFETLRELADEWAENDDRAEVESIEEKAEIDPDLQAEIDDLKSYGALATSIINNAKGQKLLDALAQGFNRLEELKAKRRAVIFTESRRTQEYLFRLLEDNGHSGRVLTINGTNADDRSGAIYRAWLERHNGEAIITGNKAVDLRAAIVEHFRDHAETLIATEAAAEGVNFQFCSLVVNYDLPWNPQRIEQRIGRCHRYGQQHDVVVINFLNRKNEADQRVFELLSEKFQLFDGIFGASDEVLGTLGSGVDFERRIARIYQECRDPDAIQAEFDQLQRELENQIKARLADTERKLFKHFDEDVRQKLRTRLTEGRRYRNHFERCLWGLTKYELGALAELRVHFDDARYQFELDKQSAEWLKQTAGHYQLLADGEAEAGNHIYRFGHTLADQLIDCALTRDLPSVEIVFDYTGYRQRDSERNPKIGVIEDRIGQAGWLSIRLLKFVAADKDEDHLLYSMTTDMGELLAPDIGEKLFLVDGRVMGASEPDAEAAASLQQHLAKLAENVSTEVAERNHRYFETEIEKLERWADDKKLSLETELKELDAQLSLSKKEAKFAADLQTKLDLHRRAKEVEAVRTRKRRELFDEQDKIEKIKDDLFEQTAVRLQQTITPTDLFTIRWRIK